MRKGRERPQLLKDSLPDSHILLVFTMPGPALPTLTNWVQERINGLYVATDDNAINAAFDAFIAKGVQSISVNGGNMSRDQYLQFVKGQKLQETSASVQFSSTVPANQGSAVSYWKIV